MQFIRLDGPSGGSACDCQKINNKWYCGQFEVYKKFEYIITDEAFHCWGIPVSEYDTIYDAACDKYYVIQDFKAPNGNINTLYANAECSEYKSGYVKNLDLKPIGPCKCEQAGLKIIK